jgi:phosphopantothenoylcysteine synthetase/decarboxylase
MNEPLWGKRIVVTAGRAREDIDGVRHYANHARPEGHGFAVARYLALHEGAEVIVVSAETALPPPAGCRVIQTNARGTPLVAGRDVMQRARQVIAESFADAAVCLASIASIVPAVRSAHKLKVKNVPGAPVTMPVVGNIDVISLAASWGVPVCGLSTRHTFFSLSSIETTSVDVLMRAVRLAPTGDEASVRLESSLTADAPQTLAGRRVIMTSGPTEEKVTAVGDVITNFSSGRQGHALATALAERGAQVVYVVGPARFAPPTHPNVTAVPVTSARSMLAACEAHLPADIFVGVAAVADFGCRQPPDLALTPRQKRDLILDQNPDILYAMGHHAQRPALVVGFAAETDPDRLLDYAAGKLTKKNADLICANLVGRRLAHNQTENRIVLVAPGVAPSPLPVLPKTGAAAVLADEMARRLVAAPR